MGYYIIAVLNYKWNQNCCLIFISLSECVNHLVSVLYSNRSDYTIHVSLLYETFINVKFYNVFFVTALPVVFHYLIYTWVIDQDVWDVTWVYQG